MGIFAASRRAVRAGVPGGSVTAEDSRWGTTARFEAVAEALAQGRDASSACAVVGRELARDGADLGEALDGLRSTWTRALGGEPGFAAVRALSVAWGEETLGYVHQLSCEDPLTGLAGREHLRTRLGEVVRAAGQRGEAAGGGHALVVLDVPERSPAPGGVPGVQTGVGVGAAPSGWPHDPFGAALRLVRLAETTRAVFAGEETVAQVGRGRLVVLAVRDERLARRTSLLRELVTDLGPEGAGARTWVERVPDSEESVAWVLDEIARA